MPRPITQEELLKFWYDALREEFGLLIPIPEGTNIETVRADLYQARADVKDPAIAGLSIHTAAKGELWIYKNPDAVLT